LVVALIFSGCSDSGGSPEDEEDMPIPGSLFSTLEAKFAGQVLAGGIELTAAQFGAQIPNAGINNQCTTISGDQADSDGDRIPVDAVLSVDCNKSFLGWSGSVTGTQSVVDTQPAAVAWAFTMDADFEVSVSGPFGGSAVNDTTGSLIATQGGALGPYSLAAALDATTSITTALGREYEVIEDFDWTVTYTPDIDWQPGGGVVVTGILDVAGAWEVGVNGHIAQTTLSTPSPLIFDPECKPTRVTDGVVEAAFEFEGKMAVVTVEWTGCDRSNVTYEHNLGAN